MNPWGLSADPTELLKKWQELMQKADPALFAGRQGAALPVDPAAMLEIQTRFQEEWTRLFEAVAQGDIKDTGDRRFSHSAWKQSMPHLVMAELYLLSSRVLDDLVDAVQVPEEQKRKLRFSVAQWVEAMSPANFLAFNPEAQQKLIESRGASLQAGLKNLMHDMTQGRISQTDESVFEVGRNLAITPGQVVFQNRLFQLIQYTPTTATVHARPILLVPPCINKFYILDLQPENSLVRHLVSEGFTVFLMSWRNPLPDDTDGTDRLTWDDYLEEGVAEAIGVTREISRQEQINALGFCVGGTLLAATLALLKARGEDPVASLTLLTTLLDFEDTGVLDLFVDEAHVALREHTIGQGGLMAARELASTFSFLRPTDLVWNYVVGNYLKGETPPAFDLLFWNGDSTNLPGPFFAWYLRNTYLENRLCKPGQTQACGEPLVLQELDMPAYVYGSREDHIVPWTAAYRSTGILSGPVRFVLGASGHIAGVINPPAKKRRSYWTCDDLPADAQHWFAKAHEHPGSWWTDWTDWLRAQSGRKQKAPAQAGSRRYPVIEAAPGSYVKARAV